MNAGSTDLEAITRAVVVGAGPVGMVTAIGLARRGWTVTLVDRDPGPPARGPWDRKGVMQFRLAHGYRPQIHQVLSDLMPDVLDRVKAQGAVEVELPDLPFRIASLCARRETLERGLRVAIEAEPRVALLVGHADEIAADRGGLAGVIVDGALVPGSLVVVATGRASHLGSGFRPPGESVPSPIAYANRIYRARPGTDHELLPIPRVGVHDSYFTLVHTYEGGLISTLIVRRSDDHGLSLLRHNEVFDAVVPHIPTLAPYLDRSRWEPVTDVMSGAGLHNSYQSPAAAAGVAGTQGLFFLGDAVLTTNPQAGRGIATGLSQVQEFLRLLDSDDFLEIGSTFADWCEQNMRPWYEDHVLWDRTLLQRWNGQELDLDAPIPSDVVCAAAAVDAEISPAAQMYAAMLATPKVLDPYRDRARDLLATGWRPPHSPGPSAQELGALIRTTTAVVG